MPRVEISVSGGVWQVGGVTMDVGQTATFRLDSTVGVTSARWELYDYPEGWGAPSGWTLASNGTIYALTNGTSPPTFTPAVAAEGWGKWLVRVFVNGESAPADDTSGLNILSPSGLEDICFMEKNQFDAQRSWIGALKRNYRLQDSGSGGGGGGGGNTPAPGGAGDYNLMDTEHVYVFKFEEAINAVSFQNYGYAGVTFLHASGNANSGQTSTLGNALMLTSSIGNTYSVAGTVASSGGYYVENAGLFYNQWTSFFTLEFLVQPLTTGALGEVIMCDTARNNKIRVMYSNTGINVEIRAGGGTELKFWETGNAGTTTNNGYLVYTIAHDLSRWHHVMLTYGAGEWKLYLDGVAVATRSGSLPTLHGTVLKANVDRSGGTYATPGTTHTPWALLRELRLSKTQRTLTYAEEFTLSAGAGNVVTPPIVEGTGYVYSFSGNVNYPAYGTSTLAKSSRFSVTGNSWAVINASWPAAYAYYPAAFPTDATNFLMSGQYYASALTTTQRFDTYNTSTEATAAQGTFPGTNNGSSMTGMVNLLGMTTLSGSHYALMSHVDMTSSPWPTTNKLWKYTGAWAQTAAYTGGSNYTQTPQSNAGIWGSGGALTASPGVLCVYESSVWISTYVHRFTLFNIPTSTPSVVTPPSYTELRFASPFVGETGSSIYAAASVNGIVTIPNVVKYNMATSTWTSLANRPGASVYNASGARHNTGINFTGGWDYPASTVKSDHLRYDIAGDTYATKTNMLDAVNNHVTAATS